MSTEKLKNWPKKVSGQIWPHGKLLPYQQTDLGMDKKNYFFTTGPYHSHLLWFKIIIPIIQTDNGEGANTRVGKESDHKMRKSSPIHKLTKQPWHKAQQTVANQWKRIQCNVCSAENKERQNELKYPECNEVFCASPCLKLYHIKLDFWRPTNRSGKAEHKDIGQYYCSSTAFSWRNNRRNWGVYFTKGLMKE